MPAGIISVQNLIQLTLKFFYGSTGTNTYRKAKPVKAISNSTATRAATITTGKRK
jgi:hypothetical protein